MFDFSDQVAVVTGGGSGIGAATCRILADLGAHVWVTDVRDAAAKTVAEEITAAGGHATAATLDVTDPAQCNEVIDGVVADAGKVDALITVAGWSETHPFLGEDDTYWRKVVDINFFGTVYPCHAALRHMTEAGYGRIVTVSSDAGRVGTFGETVYAGAKAGVIGFTKSIAREVGRRGIVANNVSPGVTDTPLMRHQDQSVIDKMVRLVTLKRLGQPEEVAAPIVFLASREAGFITGQVISASGGLTMVG
ncbi:MAG TPA: SDR family NAD(P)-dependent oxidoreductase [Acidimicrobiia bacterium]|jgi:NAD(P)-dependent dehydrogenase (short-subunit alcohol dehydrogenase family)|nr:SDR family NAD(P)-dependent oxidoreductase [Acidimicrobiia bacterium]